jgi:hypothetical protein
MIETKAAKEGQGREKSGGGLRGRDLCMANGGHGFPTLAFKAAAVTDCTSLVGITDMAAVLAGDGVATAPSWPDRYAFGSGEAQDPMRSSNQALTDGGVDPDRSGE